MTYDPLVDIGVTPALSAAKSYWLSTMTLPTYPSLTRDLTTEYLVIGGGYTGLSAALTLAEAKKQVALIDANHIGFGCSGRNAGFVLSGTGRLDKTALAKRFNADIADAMQCEFDSAVSLLKARINSHNIDCDLQAGPYLKIAYTAKHATALKHAIQTGRTSARFLPPEQVAQHLNVSHNFGAALTEGYTLNPLKYACGLAHAAEHAGAGLFSFTPAQTLQHTPAGICVTTPGGTITAEKVLITSNAYTPKRFHHIVDNKQFPVQSSILVTAPLSSSQLAETRLGSAVSAMDTRMMKYYYRSLPDGRLLFGGRGAVKGKHASSPAKVDQLERAMYNTFPTLKNVATDYFWSGWVSVALDSLPRIYVQPDGQVGYAMGYCGAGVSFSGLAGMRLAQNMLGHGEHKIEALQLPIYQSPLPDYPFPSLRRVALRLMYGWAAFTE